MDVSGHFHSVPLYYEAKTSHYPLDRRVGEPQRLSGFHGEHKNLLPMPEIENRVIGHLYRRSVSKSPEVLRHTRDDSDDLVTETVKRSNSVVIFCKPDMLRNVNTRYRIVFYWHGTS
jgi:hypothetical protein